MLNLLLLRNKNYLRFFIITQYVVYNMDEELLVPFLFSWELKIENFFSIYISRVNFVNSLHGTQQVVLENLMLKYQTSIDILE